jgi:Tfp pilus assembly protein PilE
MHHRQKFFSLIELLVVIALLAFLFTLSIKSLEKFSSHSENIECQNKLKSYAMAYNFYLEDNTYKFPSTVVRGRNTSQLHWAQVYREYPELFKVGVQGQDARFCPTFSQDWKSKNNYRGYTGVYLKQIHDIRSPKEVAILGDGIKAFLTTGYCFWEITNITDTSLARGKNDRRYREFHQDDFLHTGKTVNALFVDMHIENMDPIYMLEHKNNIWNR